MPTPESMRHPHQSIDVSGKIPVIDGGQVEVETSGPWHVWAGGKRHRFNPPEHVVVTESMAEGLEQHNAARIVGHVKKKKGPPAENKMVQAKEDKADELFPDGDG